MRTAARQDLGYVQRPFEREHRSGAVKWVGYPLAVWKIWEGRLLVCLDVVDDGSIVREDEDLSVWETECTVADVQTNEAQGDETYRGNRFTGKERSRNADGLGTPPSFGGKNSNELTGSV